MRMLVVPVLCALMTVGCGRSVPVVCDQNGAGSDMLGGACARVARAAAAELGADHPIETIVVFAWSGCYPGAFCPLVAEPGPPPAPVSATVAVRFTDGVVASVVRSVDDVRAPRLELNEVSIGQSADEFIETRLSTSGSWLILVQVPSDP